MSWERQTSEALHSCARPSSALRPYAWMHRVCMHVHVLSVSSHRRSLLR